MRVDALKRACRALHLAALAVVARRLGQPCHAHERDDRGNRATRDRVAPPALDALEAGADARRDQLPHREEHDIERHEAAAQVRRRQLADPQRHDHRRHTDADADDEAADNQRPRSLRGGLHNRTDDKHRVRERNHHLAAQPLGREHRTQRADQRTERRRGRDQLLRAVAQLPKVLKVVQTHQHRRHVARIVAKQRATQRRTHRQHPHRPADALHRRRRRDHRRVADHVRFRPHTRRICYRRRLVARVHLDTLGRRAYTARHGEKPTSMPRATRRGARTRRPAAPSARPARRAPRPPPRAPAPCAPTQPPAPRAPFLCRC